MGALETSSNVALIDNVIGCKTQCGPDEYRRFCGIPLYEFFIIYVGEQLQVPIQPSYDDINPDILVNADLVKKLTCLERFTHSARLYYTLNQYSRSNGVINQDISYSAILTALMKVAPYRHTEIVIKYLIFGLYEFKLMCNPFLKWILEPTELSIEQDLPDTTENDIHQNSWTIYLISHWGRDDMWLPCENLENYKIETSKLTIMKKESIIDLEFLSFLSLPEKELSISLEKLIAHEASQKESNENASLQSRFKVTDYKNISLSQIECVTLFEELEQWPRRFFYNVKLALKHQGFEWKEISQTLTRTYLEYIFTSISVMATQQQRSPQHEIMRLLIDFFDQTCGNTASAFTANTAFNSKIPERMMSSFEKQLLENKIRTGRFEDEVEVYNSISAKSVIKKYIAISYQNRWCSEKLWPILFRSQETRLQTPPTEEEEDDYYGPVSNILLGPLKRVLIVEYLRCCYFWDQAGNRALMRQLMRLEVNHTSVDFVFRLCRESFYQQIINSNKSMIDSDIRSLIWEFVTRNLRAVRQNIDNSQQNSFLDSWQISEDKPSLPPNHHIESVRLICKFILALDRAHIIKVYRPVELQTIEDSETNTDIGWKYLFEGFVVWIAYVEEARDVWQLARGC
ncbi:hypothetical protein NADFUDRAFT_81752 [Nadsonia fulvescens var. elongata DSM 6958]|uniref:Uncharacterized protein n=1 Tax=Nadsonia fulvescens var. elongata DSM 6958 TaxID=857566 RepID=A0A1E3PQJ8_9ASCO|nr:hypothetical protein NADFUDRAFT_81752 [Nadsonia fulvescens var. elongata DSM 6958]